ncbi:MAG TPA: hypothetical protein VEH28_07425 [Thermoplasmata archaeon]|nr:hypothetical protein [Thermoplasmata archaeon]
MSAAIRKGGPAPLEPLVEIPARHMFLGQGEPRGYGVRPKLTPEAAAAFATYVDSARARAAMEGRTLVYTVRWG